MREWEDEPVMKQPADEKRQRLDEQHVARPPSVPMRGNGSPPHPQTGFEAEAQARHQVEKQHRVNESYHPSEAAHHAPSLPAINQQPNPSPQAQHLPRMSEAVKEEPRREIVHEPAARRVEVDENYDDDEEEKRPAPVAPVSSAPESKRDSPKSATGVPGPEPAAATAGA
jgi:hypothetical protein